MFLFKQSIQLAFIRNHLFPRYIVNLMDRKWSSSIEDAVKVAIEGGCNNYSAENCAFKFHASLPCMIDSYSIPFNHPV